MQSKLSLDSWSFSYLLVGHDLSVVIIVIICGSLLSHLNAFYSCPVIRHGGDYSETACDLLAHCSVW